MAASSFSDLAITGVNRGTVAALALKVGRGAAELHDRMVVGVRTSRLELDELWAFVGKKRKRCADPTYCRSW